MEQAHHALIDPLIEPDPSQETGLNSHFRSTFAPRQDGPITPPGSADLAKDGVAVSSHRTGSSIGSNPFMPQHTGSSVETNPYRRSRASSEAKGPSASASQHSKHSPGRSRQGYPSPPNSASPHRDHFFDHRADAFGSMNDSRSRRSSQPSSANPFVDGSSGLVRGGSLKGRYPGDNSHRPLDTIRKDNKIAYRSPHLRKKNFSGADIIDRLDKSGVSRYHHEGPYDAASIARNKDKKYSPVAAVQESNDEALRATPRENIADAVDRHRPLEGVATVPPGMPDKFGRVLNYEEGTDMQRDPLNRGDYKRIPGMDYHPDDLKGKGEPSYSEDQARKDKKRTGDSGTEMKTRHSHSKSAGYTDATAVPAESFEAEASGIGRSNSTSKNMGTALKKRFGSLRRRKHDADA